MHTHTHNRCSRQGCRTSLVLITYNRKAECKPYCPLDDITWAYFALCWLFELRQTSFLHACCFKRARPCLQKVMCQVGGYT